MNEQVLVAITQGVNLVGVLGPLAIGAALALKRRLSAGGDDRPFDVVIQQYKDGVLRKVEETDAIIAEWRATHPE